jgi:hypothetical protein
VCAHRSAILVVYVLLFKHLVRNLSFIIHSLIQHRIAPKQTAKPNACTETPVIPRLNPLPVPLSAPLYFPVCPYIHLSVLFVCVCSDNRANDTGLVDVGQRWLEGNTAGGWEGKSLGHSPLHSRWDIFVWHCSDLRHGLVTRKKWCLSFSLL